MQQRKLRASPGGRVFLVGAGPGDPELITVKAVKVLSEADVIIYDRLVPVELLEYAKPGAELIYAGKEPGRHSITQEEINRLLVDRASKGLLVVRLKGGDPLVFGRGEEECLYAWSNNIPCQIIPGIPSFVGGGAEYIIPLGSRRYSRIFSVLTGTVMGDKPLDKDRMRGILEASDTVVVLMGARQLRVILEAVAEARGRDEIVALVRNATRGDSTFIIGRVGKLLENEVKLPPPLLIYIGGGPKWLVENTDVLH